MSQFITPDLSYSYDALEPHIDKETMMVHHDKHHVAYTTNLNKALEKYPDLFQKTPEEILMNIDQVPQDIRVVVKNHGGGHVHHSLFWETIGPAKDSGQASGPLLAAIDASFGSFEKFKEDLSAMAMSVFGAGWAWLVVDQDAKLLLVKTANQDSPYSSGQTPILGIDVWEHAYYLKYQNRRADFVQNFWSVINWAEVGKKYQTAIKK